MPDRIRGEDRKHTENGLDWCVYFADPQFVYWFRLSMLFCSHTPAKTTAYRILRMPSARSVEPWAPLRSSVLRGRPSCHNSSTSNRSLTSSSASFGEKSVIVAVRFDKSRISRIPCAMLTHGVQESRPSPVHSHR